MELAVAITTCSHRAEDIRIGYVLGALANLKNTGVVSALDIFVHDEGSVPITVNCHVPMLIDRLRHEGHDFTYKRNIKSYGVATARQRTLALIPGHYDKVLLVDDDLLVAHNAIDLLVYASLTMQDWGFIQGTKIELDQRRVYVNDLNKLNDAANADSLNCQPLVFGDAAFLLLNRAALRHINWDVLMRFGGLNLAGEDVAMSLMISDQMPCYGLPGARGYHMSLGTPRWTWELHSDVLQLNLLKGVVSDATLAKAMPHLASYLRMVPTKET